MKYSDIGCQVAECAGGWMKILAVMSKEKVGVEE
jgi:hypothetical protein